MKNKSKTKLIGPFESEGFEYYLADGMKFMKRELEGDGWEADRRKEFLKHCSLVKISIDVGAFAGTHLIPMAAASKKTYAFEPNRRNLEVIKTNIKLNNLSKKIRLYECAAGESEKTSNLLHQTQTKELVVSNGEPEHHLNQVVSDINEAQQKSINPIKVISIDSILEKQWISANDVSLMKIDVEGYEEKVLLGAKKLLTESKDLAIYLETHPGCVIDPKCREKCYSMLENLGYETLIEFNDYEAIWKKKTKQKK